MMEMKRNKVKKKVWEKPKIKTVQFNETAGGNPYATGEDFAYDS
jgi:hypothetical protein